MAKKTAVGIDVGTYQIRVVVAVQNSQDQKMDIIGSGRSTSRGIRHGYVVSRPEIAKMLQVAVTHAEKSSGTAIRSAFLSIGGIGLEESRSHAEILVSRADNVVTEMDIKNVVDDAEKKVSTRELNRKVIHIIPIAYYLDGQRLLGRAVGMKGTKLAVDVLLVSMLEQHVEDLIAAVEDCGISVLDVMASPLAGSFVTLTTPQKIAGVVLANLGSETLSVVVYENGLPFSVKVFPVGSVDITHDIALGLRISLDDAEQAKRGALIDTASNKKLLDNIILSRVQDIFKLLDAHLKRIGKSGLLPAGIVLSGGGSGITTIEDIAKAVLKIPSRRATLLGIDKSQVKDSSWAVAYGLCIWGLKNDGESSNFSTIKENARGAIGWLKQFLP